MHYSRHRLTTLVAYVTTFTYVSTNDQWIRPAYPLVSSVRLSYVALYAPLAFQHLHSQHCGIVL